MKNCSYFSVFRKKFVNKVNNFFHESGISLRILDSIFKKILLKNIFQIDFDQNKKIIF